MSFSTQLPLDNFLFYDFNIKTIPALILLCVVTASFAFLFEWIRLLQAKQRQRELVIRSKQLKAICPVMENSSLLPKRLDKPLDLSLKHRALLYSCDAGLWISLHNLGYLIMLIVMYYSVWLFISVLIGGGLGYFIFGQQFMKLNMENCAVIRDTYCMANCHNPDPTDGESTPAMVASTSTARPCHSSSEVDVQVCVHEPLSND